jgi:hypothetical protein
MHEKLEAQIHRDKKNTKPQETKIQSQGHKTLMYGTWMHVGTKAKIHNKEKKNTKPWKAENPFTWTQNPYVGKNGLEYLGHGLYLFAFHL